MFLPVQSAGKNTHRIPYTNDDSPSWKFYALAAHCRLTLRFEADLRQYNPINPINPIEVMYQGRS